MEETQEKKIRVLIVDDSGLRREMLRVILESDPRIEVMGFARNGKEGVKTTLSMKPDVVTMDIEMPEMDGFEAIDEIMKQRPTPIIVVSSVEPITGARALGIGAMDIVTISKELDEIAKELIDKVMIASRVKPLRRLNKRNRPKKIEEEQKKEFTIVAIGSSTGGPAALNHFLSTLPEGLPICILVVQHIMENFITELTGYLQISSKYKICMAQNGTELKEGTVYFAPDHYHMEVSANHRLILKEESAYDMTFTPSIDVLFESVAKRYGEHSIGIIMTGMGTDGVQGIKAIREAGGVTLAQDEATSVVYGMNKVAVDSGYVDMELPLDKISEKVTELCSEKETVKV